MGTLMKVLAALFFLFMGIGLLVTGADCGSLFVGAVCAIISASLFMNLHNEPVPTKEK
jgi:hypothetical protein